MGRPPKDPNREETTERILRAAETAFGKLGFQSTRLSDIADDVGIRRPSLLYHYKTKEELYTEVVKRAFHEVQIALAEALETSGNYTERLDRVVDALVHVAEDRRQALAVILREFVDPYGTNHAFVMTELKKLLESRLYLILRVRVIGLTKFAFAATAPLHRSFRNHKSCKAGRKNYIN